MDGRVDSPLGFSPLWFEPRLGPREKAKFCLQMVRWFFPGFSGFRPPLMNDRLDISEIFLKGPKNPNQKKKKKKKKKNGNLQPEQTKPRWTIMSFPLDNNNQAPTFWNRLRKNPNEERSKVISHNWVKNCACYLPHNIHFVKFRYPALKQHLFYDCFCYKYLILHCSFDRNDRGLADKVVRGSIYQPTGPVLMLYFWLCIEICRYV